MKFLKKLLNHVDYQKYVGICFKDFFLYGNKYSFKLTSIIAHLHFVTVTSKMPQDVSRSIAQIIVLISRESIFFVYFSLFRLCLLDIYSSHVQSTIRYVDRYYISILIINITSRLHQHAVCIIINHARVNENSYDR